MSDIVHVIRATVDPVAAPTRGGQHWINETTKKTWLSVGTSTVSDWILIGDSDQVKISATDTTAEFLGAKLAAGTGIALTTLNPGANEVIQISAPGSTTDEKVKVSATDTAAGYLNTEFTVSNGSNTISPLEKTITNPGADEKLNVQFDQTKISITASQVSDFAEIAQDSVGASLTDTASIDFTYSDSLNQMSAVVIPGGVDHNSLQNFVANKHIDHSTVSISAGTGLSGGGDTTASRTISLANTAVTPGSYGSSTQVSAITVDAQGRLTSASSTTIQIAESQVTSLTTDLSAKADKVTTISAGSGLSGGGDLSTSRTISMPNVGTAGTYGSASATSVITTDAQGRISSASTTAVAIPSSQVTDFSEAVDDRVAALIVPGAGIGVSYNDPANTLTISSSITQYTDENAQDAVGNALLDSSSVDFTYNDAGNSITAVVLPAGVDHNSLQNFVANKHIDHSAVSLIAGTGISSTGLGDLTASRTINLANTTVTASSYGSATQIPIYTVNAQGQLTAASNTLVAIPSTQITDWNEAVDDRVAALIIAGTGITAVYNDPANTLTINSSITQYTDEQAQDTVAALIQSGTGISWSYNDALNTLTPTVSLSPFTTTNLTEGTNLYFTNTRVQSAISITDTASIDLTYVAGNISGVVLPAGVDHNSLLNFVANKHIDHSTVNITAGTGLSGGGDLTATRTLNLANTAVVAGSYGSATQVPNYTVDAQGRLTSSTNVTISILASQVSDFSEAVDDRVAALVVAGTGISVAYSDPSNTLTISASGIALSDEKVKASSVDTTADYLNSKIAAGTGLTKSTLNPTANEQIQFAITNTTVTAGSYGSATQVPTFTVNAQGQLTAAANTSIAIPSTQVTDWNESVDDRVAALLVAGSGISIAYNDPSNSLTISSSVTQYTDEMAQDTVTSLLQNGTGIGWSYNDVANTLTPAVSLSPFSTTNLAEGANLYFTNSRAQSAISVTDSGSIDFTYTAGALTAIVLPAGVDHNSLNNFVANKHIDHSTVVLVAGTGISATGLGDLTASRTINLANTSVTASSYGSATQVSTFTVNAQGQLTAAANTAIQIAESQVTGLTTDLAAKVPNTVQVIAGSGLTGGGALTSNVTVSMPNIGTAGVYGDSTHYPIITTDAQGRVTATSIGTISSGYWSVDINLDAGGLLTWSNGTGQDLCIRQAGSTGSSYIRQVSSNGSLVSPTATTSGQRLGGNGMYGWNSDGVNGLPSGAINVYATQNHTPTSQGGEVRIELIPNGSVTPVTTAIFENNGDLNLTGGLHVGDTTDTSDGYIRYNVATNEFQGRQSSAWIVFAQVPVTIFSTVVSSTTSATFATVAGMTTTPAAGIYKLDFTSAVTVSTAATNGDFGVFIAGVEQAQCRRSVSSSSTTAISSSVAISTIITVNGSQAVTVQFRENASGTVTANARELILTPVSR